MIFSYFLVTYSLTIVLSRVWLWFVPRHAPQIGNFQWHHWMTGVLLIVVYLIYPNLFLLAIGAALIVDQIPLFFIFKGLNWPDDCWKEYQSVSSTIGTFLVSLIVMVVYLSIA